MLQKLFRADSTLLSDIQVKENYKNRKTSLNRFTLQTNFYQVRKTLNIEKLQNLDKSILSAAQLGKTNGTKNYRKLIAKNEKTM